MKSKLLILLSSLLMISALLVGCNKEKIKIHNNKVVIEEIVPVLPEKPAISLDTYFPVIKDTVWKFEGEEVGDEYTISIDFLKDKVFQLRIQNQQEAMVKVYIEEEGSIYEVATIEQAKIKQDYTNFRQYKEALLKLPLEKNNTWQNKEGQTRTITDTDVIVDTEIGSFKAIEVTTKGEDFLRKDYYGEKIGPIKTVYKKNGKKSVKEITSFSTNQPMEQEITLYVANINTSKLEDVEQKILVHTNEEPKHFLTDLLKKEMGEWYVTAMPKNAVIENIYMDDDDKQLQINMSKEFYEMNYGSYIESLAIKSVVQTIGIYYGAKEVLLTVEGEPYKSEHILFKEGETISILKQEE